MKCKCSHKERVTFASQICSSPENGASKSRNRQILIPRSAASMAMVQLIPMLTGFFSIQSVSRFLAHWRVLTSSLNLQAFPSTGKNCNRENSHGTFTSEPSKRTTMSDSLLSTGHLLFATKSTCQSGELPSAIGREPNRGKYPRLTLSAYVNIALHESCLDDEGVPR